MDAAAVGHCLRVDSLRGADARALAALINAPSFDVAVLGDGLGGTMAAERAVEIRNRKAVRLCLFVPSELGESSSSSLGNSFAAFDLDDAMRDAVRTMTASLPDAVRQVVQAAVSVQRGVMRPAAEDVGAYVSVVCEEPSPGRAGLELWRLGLIPDGGADGVMGRLDDNARCARGLVRPVRPQMTVDERLSEIGMRPGSTRDRLAAHLRGRSLRDARAWLAGLALPAAAGITFENWPLESDPLSDLEEIVVAPFVGASGKVEPWTSLTQRGGEGTEPVAVVGPKSKVTVRWKTVPRNPVNLARWRLRVVPSKNEHPLEDPGAIDLPETSAAKGRRTASIGLDLDLGSLDIRAVTILIVALDEFGAEIKKPDGSVIEGLSDEFWLDDRGDVQGDGHGGSTRRETVANLALGRLVAAADPKVTAIPEAAGTWIDSDLAYFASPLGPRHVAAIATSPVLKSLEEKVLSDAASLGAYRSAVGALGTVDPDWGLEPVETSALRRLTGFDTFLARRREAFKVLRGASGTGLIETVAWSTDLASRAKAYARAYRDLVSQARVAGIGAEALGVDVLRLAMDTGAGVDEAALVMPTHPLRLLWYSAYAELLNDWERRLIEAGKARSSLVEMALLSRVAPLNVPAFVPAPGGRMLLFAGNLRFFWGVALPVSARDPGRRTAEVARCLGLPDAEVALGDVPPSSVARELRTYLELHPYAPALRLQAANVGSGSLLADALRELYLDRPPDEDPDDAPPRLDLVATALSPAPVDIAPLTALRDDLYSGRVAGRHSYLNPLFAYSVREAASDREGDFNVTLAIDPIAPSVQPIDQGHGDSASFYGLLVRFWSTYEAGPAGARWTHAIELPIQSARERHPVNAPATDDLADVHREMLLAASSAIGGGDGTIPAVVAQVGPEDRAAIDDVHARSDWVLTLDRFLGPEFYDDPADPDMARIARTYVLDYGPEFLEGLGHRLMVTTTQRAEVVSVLSRAMYDLGFGLVEESVGDVLEYLKVVSGRLALRVIGDDAHAREAVSLGVVAAYLDKRGDLRDSILIPVDSHPELFGVSARKNAASRARCDLLRIRFSRTRMDVGFIEVKSRSAAAHSEELMNRIVDQIEATEEVMRDLFFRRDDPRLDRTLQRSRLATILRFYLGRAARHGLLSSETIRAEMAESIDRLEAGIPHMRTERLGFVVNLQGTPQQPVKVRDTAINFLCAADLATVGFATATPLAAPVDQRPGQEEDAAESPGIRESRPAPIGGPTQEGEPGPVPSHEVNGMGGGVATDDDAAVDVTPRPAAPSVTVDVRLGERLGDGDVVTWTPSVRGSPHLFILGIPGQGKSWTVARILRAFAAEGLPALVFDFHGQFSHSGLIGSAPAAQVIDAADGLPFSPFETEIHGAEHATWRTGAFAIAEILQYVCELGDIQRDLAYQAIRDCYVDRGYGDGVTGTGVPTVSEVRERIEQLEVAKGVRNVSARSRPILEFGLFREKADPEASDTMLERGAVVDVHSLSLESLQLAAGAFLLRRVYKEMFSWGQSDTLRLAIVLDEAHRLARDVTLPKLMKEGRKFGILVVVASQGLADYHPDVVGNAGTKIVYRTNFPMSKRVSGFLRAPRSVDLAAAIEQLDVGEAYVQTPEMSSAARVRMYPLE